MKRPGVNLLILWEEYRDAHPDGYSYSRFCDLFREFERRLSPVTRQHHAAGDKLFVDYSGKNIVIADPATGGTARGGDFRRRARRLELHLRGGDAHASLARLDWRACADAALFRRVAPAFRARQPEERRPQAVFYDPEINRSYATMAAHYDVGVLRPGRESRRTKPKSRPGFVLPKARFRPAAPSDLLLFGRVQQRDREGARSHERPAVFRGGFNSPATEVRFSASARYGGRARGWADAPGGGGARGW